MRNRFLGSIIFFIAVFALSSVPLAHSGQTGAQRAPAASNKPFDAHDLTGYWELTNIGRPPGALNTIGNNRPPMTDWARGVFGKTKTGYKELSSGVYPENQRNDPALWCDPLGGVIPLVFGVDAGAQRN